jgi:hypothetical protein
MITLCRACGKTLNKDRQGRGVKMGWCLPPRVCGLLALAEEDMLDKEEVDKLNELLGGIK